MSEKRGPGKLAHGEGPHEPATGTTRQAGTARQPAQRAAGPGPHAGKADGESAVLAKIAAMPEPYRSMGERLHGLIRASAPALEPRLWYGMPAYAKDGKVICFFRGGEKERYMTLGFTEEAKLDEGGMWPTAFALKELTAAEEARIAALVQRAVG